MSDSDDPNERSGSPPEDTHQASSVDENADWDRSDHLDPAEDPVSSAETDSPSDQPNGLDEELDRWEWADGDLSETAAEDDSNHNSWDWLEETENDTAGSTEPAPAESDTDERSMTDDRLWNSGEMLDQSENTPDQSENTPDQSENTPDQSENTPETVTPAFRSGQPEPHQSVATESGDHAARQGRIWNSTDRPVRSTDSAQSRDSVPATGKNVNRSTSGPERSDRSEPTEISSTLPETLSLSPGTSVLIEAESRSEQAEHGCHDLLFDGAEPDPHVLLIRYKPIDADRLRDIAANADQTHIVAVGYTQSVPNALTDTVELTQVNNPNDITRLGIVVSRIIETWPATDNGVSVCYDSLNFLLNYRDPKEIFRFLHVFLSTFTKTDAVAHFHADPLEADLQAINTLKPLFDEVVSIDSAGNYVD